MIRMCRAASFGAAEAAGVRDLTRHASEPGHSWLQLIRWSLNNPVLTESADARRFPTGVRENEKEAR
jgi:hypothetical protein